jgi:predicted Zn-dependent protease
VWQAEAALRHFQRAAEMEPDFAAAHAGIAKSYCHLEYEQVLPASAAYPKVSAAAEKALALNPHNADAHAALSYLYAQRDWDFNRAEQELKRAIVDGPGNSIGHRWYRYILQMKGRKEEALEQARLAMKTDPASVTLVLQYGLELANCKRYDDAISALRDAQEFDLNDQNVRFLLVEVYKKAGKFDLAAVELDKAYRMSGHADQADQFQKDLKRVGFLKAAEAAKRADFERDLRELKKKSARKEFVSPTAYVDTYARLHDKENTLKWLEAAYVADSHVLVELREERFDFVRQEPRFKKVWDNVPFLH